MKRLSAATVSSRLLQRLLGHRRLEDEPEERIVIYPPEDEGMRPAICLPGELDRIHGVHEFSAGLKDEIHLATRSAVHHTETIAYRFRNLLLANGQLCSGRSLKRLTFERVRPGIHIVEEVSDCVALCSTDAGNDYFAHFVLDDASTAVLGHQFGRIVFAETRRARTDHARDYLRAFGIHYADVAAAHFKEVWLFKDYPQNSHRRERLQELRERLSARAQPESGTSAPAYIRRGRSGAKRILDNEAEIEELLAARGFNIIDPEAQTMEQISTTLNQSPLVIGVEGSQLAHGVLHLKAGGALVCIQPAARFNAVYRGFANTLGLSWGFVIADGTAERFHLPAGRLLATIDLAMART